MILIKKISLFGIGQSEKIFDMARNTCLRTDMGKGGKKSANKLVTYFKAEQVKSLHASLFAGRKKFIILAFQRELFLKVKELRSCWPQKIHKIKLHLVLLSPPHPNSSSAWTWCTGFQSLIA